LRPEQVHLPPFYFIRFLADGRGLVRIDLQRPVNKVNGFAGDMVTVVKAHLKFHVPVFIEVFAGVILQVQAIAIKVIEVQAMVVQAGHVDEFDAVFEKDLLDAPDLDIILFFALLLAVGFIVCYWFGYGFITAAVIKGSAANIITEPAVAASGAERVTALAASFAVFGYLVFFHPFRESVKRL
jgi:hypothetical protein